MFLLFRKVKGGTRYDTLIFLHTLARVSFLEVGRGGAVLSILINSRGISVLKNELNRFSTEAWLILNLEQNHELLVKSKILQRSINWIRAALIFRQKRGNFAIPTISNRKESVSSPVRRRTRPITPLPEIFVKGEQSRRKVSEVPLLCLVVATMHRFIIREMMMVTSHHNVIVALPLPPSGQDK